MSETKKPFRVVGLRQGVSMTTHAKRVEDALNTLREEGYMTEIIRQPLGVLIVGELPHENLEEAADMGSVHSVALPKDHPLAQMLRAQLGERDEADEARPLSPRSRELAQRFLQHIDTSDAVAFEREARSHLGAFTQGFGANELLVASKEMLADVEHHRSRCSRPGCTFDRVFVTLSEILREAAGLNFQ